MKRKWLIITMVLLSAFMLAGCRKAKPLVIWVGAESAEFYQQKMDEYVEDYQTTNGSAFPFVIEVKGVDTGSAAATYLEDMQAGPDIFTVAHDNLGKLITGASSIAPVTNPGLLAQIDADNPDVFLDVIKGVVGGVEYTFGVPYVAQALVLYYNKAYVNEAQVQTWEGILEAARAAGIQALSLVGTDGFNNSFLILANNAATGESSLKLYENGDINENYAVGDDLLSVLKWGQRFFNDPNGARRPTDSGWQIELMNEVSLSTISGAWHFNAASAALGGKLGIAMLPTFTITEQDVYGDVPVGTVMQSGTFSDAKMFVMKKNSEKAEYLQDILLYLSSKEMQELSYIAAANLPAYKNAINEFESMQDDTIETDLAIAQLEMFAKGMPQPFGFDNRFNFYYYSKGGPELIMEILENKDGLFNTDAAILTQMLNVQNIWKTGNPLS